MEKNNETLHKPSLQEEVESLKRQIGGYKSSNEKYRKEIALLKQELSEVSAKRDEINEQVATLTNQILVYKDKISELRTENNDLHLALSYEQKPWWKKLF